MSTKFQSSELEKYRVLTLATLDYLITRHAGEFVVDGYDSIKQHFEDQKAQVEDY